MRTALCQRLGIDFLEGDDLHTSAAIAKMSSGVPLSDDDREPWLTAIGTWLAVRSRIARLPEGATWLHIYGVALICGIGFTMSLFIGSLAWPHTDYDAKVRLAVIVGSLASAVGGIIVLTIAGVRDAGDARQ